MPDKIEVRVGDEVTLHVTNVEQTTDMIHGLGIVEHDINIVVDPGRDQDGEVHGEQAGRLIRSTARTSARRCTRRCRDISRCGTPGEFANAHRRQAPGATIDCPLCGGDFLRRATA